MKQLDDRPTGGPTASASRALRPDERGCSVTELEAFALVRALESSGVRGSWALARTHDHPLLRNSWKVSEAGMVGAEIAGFCFDPERKNGRCSELLLVLL